MAATAHGTDLAEILEEVRRIEILGRRQVTDALAGGYHSVFRGSGVEFDDVREYAEGDDVRSVDWNVTARVGRPFVRRYVDERERRVIFLVDVSASMGGGFGPWSARGTAARVCACLALSAARNDDRTGLLAFASGIESWIPPRRGPGHVLRILRDCLALPSPPGPTDMVPALEFTLRGVPRHAVIFVLSDFLADGWGPTLARCARRHDAVAVRLLLPERELPAAGLLRLRDPESGREEIVDSGDPATRAALAERVLRRRERTEDDLRRGRVDLLDIPVPRARERDVVSGPLLRFFRMREARGAKR